MLKLWRDLRWTPVLVVLSLLAVRGYAQAAAPWPETPQQLIHDVVYNELTDHQQHGYWRYWVARRAQNDTVLENRVETSAGPVVISVLVNGRPLSAEARQQEESNLDHLLGSPQEQARRLRQYDQDEERIGRVVAMLPDAFLYEPDGQENGCYRLRFRPNPAYSPRSIEARIFHAMSGRLWVDARYKRLAALEGHVDENVDFGFGLLGRLCKGGWFHLQRVRVSPTDWKTERLEMHMNLHALLVASFARETSEVRGGFVQVPAGMSVAQAAALLKQPGAGQPEAETPQAISAAFAFKP